MVSVAADADAEVEGWGLLSVLAIMIVAVKGRTAGEAWDCCFPPTHIARTVGTRWFAGRRQMRLDAARAFSGRAFVRPVSGTGRKPCWMEARAVTEEERTLFDIRHEAHNIHIVTQMPELSFSHSPHSPNLTVRCQGRCLALDTSTRPT